MGFCVYFHRTWTPGYNSEYIDPNLAFSFQRKLNLAKKIAWWMFIITLLSCIIFLLVTLSQRSHDPSFHGKKNSTTMKPSSRQQRLTQQQPPKLTDTEPTGLTQPLTETESAGTTTTTELTETEEEHQKPSSEPTELTQEPSPEKSKELNHPVIEEPNELIQPSSESTRTTRLTKPYVTKSIRVIEDCRKGAFVCDKNVTGDPAPKCIHKSLVCDSIKDCSNGRDEALCYFVSKHIDRMTSMTLNNRKIDKIEGFILVRVKGSWHPYCTDNWTEEIGEKLCKFLEFEKFGGLQTVELSQINHRLGVQLSGMKKSSEENQSGDRSQPLWLLDEDYNWSTRGPIEEVITESTSEEHNCTVGYLHCSK